MRYLADEIWEVHTILTDLHLRLETSDVTNRFGEAWRKYGPES